MIEKLTAGVSLLDSCPIELSEKTCRRNFFSAISIRRLSIIWRIFSNSSRLRGING